MKTVEFSYRIIFSLIGISLLPISYFHLSHQWQLRELVTELESSQKIDPLLKRWSELNQIPSPMAKIHQDYYYFRFLIELDEWQKALNLGFSLQRSFPGFYDLEHWLSLLELQNKNFKGAIYWIEKAIDYHPMDESNYFLKALIFKKMGLTEESEKIRLEGLKIGKRNLTFRDN